MTEVYRQDVFRDAPAPEGEGWVLVHAQCEVFHTDAGRRVRDEVRWWTRERMARAFDEIDKDSRMANLIVGIAEAVEKLPPNDGFVVPYSTSEYGDVEKFKRIASKFAVISETGQPGELLIRKRS